MPEPRYFEVNTTEDLDYIKAAYAYVDERGCLIFRMRIEKPEDPSTVETWSGTYRDSACFASGFWHSYQEITKEDYDKNV